MKKIFKLDELKNIAVNILDELKNKKSNNSTILGLSGELGSGKTTLTQNIANILGVKEKVISPTFVILKKYKTKDEKFKNLIHIDAYRLESSKELINLGWNDIIEDENNLIIVEWPENVSDCLNNNISRIFLNHKDNQTRTIETLI